MRAAVSLPVIATGLLLMAAAPAPTPEAAWKAGIADQNKDYAQTPHAMLKSRSKNFGFMGKQLIWSSAGA